MKTIFYAVVTLIIVIVAINTCGGSVYEMEEYEEAKTINNVIRYLKNNSDTKDVENFQLIYENVSKQMPCPSELIDLVKLYGDEASITVYFGETKSKEFLNPDKEKGHITMYGLKFSVDGSEVTKTHSMYDFSDSKYIESVEPLDLSRLVNKHNLKKLNHFYNTEMKYTQMNNKDKCN